MKYIKMYLSIFCASILFTHICNMDLTGTIVRDLTKNTLYSLGTGFIKPFFSSEIRVINLKDKTGTIIARFQLPYNLPNEQDYPQFSPDNKFLLILNAPWSPLYDTNPLTYEWNLFDIAAQKTIKTFPRDSYPTFEGSTTVTYTQYGKKEAFIIPTKTPGLFNRVTNYLTNLFVITPPTPVVREPISQPIISERQTKERPESPSTPTEAAAKTEVQKSLGDIKKINNESAELPQHPAISTKVLFDTLELLKRFTQQPIVLQNALAKEYIRSMQRHIPSYRNAIAQYITIQPDISASYEKARQALKEIDELSSFMLTQGELEVVNSPEMVNGLKEKILIFCLIVLNLTEVEQNNLFFEALPLIKKYHTLYNDIFMRIASL